MSLNYQTKSTVLLHNKSDYSKKCNNFKISRYKNKINKKKKKYNKKNKQNKTYEKKISNSKISNQEKIISHFNQSSSIYIKLLFLDLLKKLN